MTVLSILISQDFVKCISDVWLGPFLLSLCSFVRFLQVLWFPLMLQNKLWLLCGCKQTVGVSVFVSDELSVCHNAAELTARLSQGQLRPATGDGWIRF